MKFSSSEKIIGIDLGGTKVNLGRIENGKITEQKQRLIPSDSENMWDIINLIISSIKEILTDGVVGIGIGVPSIVDKEKGIIYNVQNIKSWREVHLKEILEKELKIPVFIDNDANCFAMGEYRFGAGQNCKSMVGLITGTGMGAGIVNNGHLLKDANSGSGEFGMIPYLDADYESYCSGQFFQNRFGTGGEELAIRTQNGDKQAIEAFCQYGTHLGNALKMIMYAIDPEKIIIGGSVSKSNKLFKESMYESMSNFAFPTSLKKIAIEFSETQNIAVLGAASLYFDQL